MFLGLPVGVMGVLLLKLIEVMLSCCELVCICLVMMEVLITAMKF